MSHITLVRHGQANSGARDEESYDKLSPLGHVQAEWLGAHLRGSRAHHTRVYAGTLTRHIETAASAGFTESVTRDSRLNEMEYFALATCLEEQKGLPIPRAREGFVDHLPQVYAAWEAGEIAGPPESWRDFESRVASALAEIAAGEGPAIVFTSGGVIAMAMRLALELDTLGMARITLGIMNSSMTRLYPIGGHLSPVLFNAVPHLEDPERHHAQTHL